MCNIAFRIVNLGLTGKRFGTGTGYLMLDDSGKKSLSDTCQKIAGSVLREEGTVSAAPSFSEICSKAGLFAAAG
jgi:hypothetical protein